MDASPEPLKKDENKKFVCVDSSLVVALLVPERFSQAALTQWERWLSAEIEITAPQLLRYEVASAVYRKAFQGQISWDDGQIILNQFLKLDIFFSEQPGLPIRACDLAKEFKRPNTYDAFYLALAESLRCHLWTGDERLYNAVRGRFSLIHWLGEGENERL